MNLFGKLRLQISPKTSQSFSQPSTTVPPSNTVASDLTTPGDTIVPLVSTPPPQISRLQSAGQTGYLSGRPGLARTLWAAHPNKTTRKLRKLLVSWEELGFFFSFSRTQPQLSPAAENSFLKAKVAVANSVSFLKSIHGMGDIRREASTKERDFIEILELFPSLHSALAVSEEDRRELFDAWHSLYLFLHRVLGADPYEVPGESVPSTAAARREIGGARRNVRPLREGKTA